MSSSFIEIDTKSSKPKSGRKLKTMLLFPPEWVPTAPYLALPNLTAVLRENGQEVTQRDINIEMYELFFSDMFNDLYISFKKYFPGHLPYTAFYADSHDDIHCSNLWFI